MPDCFEGKWIACGEQKNVVGCKVSCSNPYEKITICKISCNEYKIKIKSLTCPNYKYHIIGTIDKCSNKLISCTPFESYINKSTFYFKCGELYEKYTFVDECTNTVITGHKKLTAMVEC